MSNKRTLISELPKFVGKKVHIRGWLYQFRDLGKIGFAIIRDRTGIAQVVVEDQALLEQLRGLHPESVLYIDATVQETKYTKTGVELINPAIKIVVKVTEPAPIKFNSPKTNVNLDTAIHHRTLLLRNPKYAFIFKVQGTLLNQFVQAFSKRDFVHFRPPTLLATPSESGADVFEVNFFDKQIAYLAQSPQFYKQIMLIAFERVFTITPVFRAEKHDTSRHLLELTQIDGEMAFVDSAMEVMRTAENILLDVLTAAIDLHKDQFQEFGYDIPTLPKKEIPVLTVKEALKLIEKETGKSAKRAKLDLDPHDEKVLHNIVKQQFDSDLVWVYGFHANKNPYTYDDRQDPEVSQSYDLLFKGLEILSGTIRINDYQTLKQNLSNLSSNLDYYHHYLEAMKYGMPPEGGFSFGLERLTKQLLGLQNIKEAVLFPTDLKRIAGQPVQTPKNQ